MNYFSLFLIWGTLGVTLYSVIAISLAVYKISKSRYKIYQEKYDQFMIQKHRVEEKLNQRSSS